MNASVTATDRLKLRIRVGIELDRDELEDVGVVDAEHAHVGAAPRAALLDRLGRDVEHLHERRPGPSAVPPVEATRSPAGRRRENEKPVPPPVFWISAAQRTASKTPVVESSTGTTKHAASWPSGRPAFISVGELGRNSSAAIMRSKLARGRGDLGRARARRRLGGGDVPRDAPNSSAGVSCGRRR